MKLYKSELISIAVPNGTTQLRFYFPDNSLIRTTPDQKVYTKGIEFYNAQIVAKAPDGSTTMGSADMQKGYLTLYIEDGEYVKIPLSRLIMAHNNTVTGGDVLNYPYVFNVPDMADLQVNWPKSYISFPATLGATNVTILCTVYYDFTRVGR